MTVRPATLRALWTDWNDGYPSRSDEPFRWEIWLRRTDGREIRRFREFADLAGFHAGETHLGFDDLITTSARAAPDALEYALRVLGDLAELRRGGGRVRPSNFTGGG